MNRIFVLPMVHRRPKRDVFALGALYLDVDIDLNVNINATIPVDIDGALKIDGRRDPIERAPIDAEHSEAADSPSRTVDDKVQGGVQVQVHVQVNA